MIVLLPQLLCYHEIICIMNHDCFFCRVLPSDMHVPVHCSTTCESQSVSSEFRHEKHPVVLLRLALCGSSHLSRLPKRRPGSTIGATLHRPRSGITGLCLQGGDQKGIRATRPRLTTDTTCLGLAVLTPDQARGDLGPI